MSPLELETDFRELVIEHAADLPPQQRLIADYLLEHMQTVPFMSVPELAQRIGVSEATIVRFAQRIGYAGFSELKMTLVEMIQGRLGTAGEPEQQPVSDDVLTSIAALEISNIQRTIDQIDRRQALEQHFESLAFHNPIPPGETVAGFILTNLDEGVKMVQVDLVSSQRHKSFSFLSDIPGFRSDYQAREVFIRDFYSEDRIINYTDENTFRAALEALPCCVTNKKGTKHGDPLNLVIIFRSQQS